MVTPFRFYPKNPLKIPHAKTTKLNITTEGTEYTENEEEFSSRCGTLRSPSRCENSSAVSAASAALPA